MSLIQDSRNRLLSLLNEIEKIKQSDFPYNHTEDALKEITNTINNEITSINKAIETVDIQIVINKALLSIKLQSDFLPILGFLLRSTNTRNGFESYYPLLDIAQKLMGDEIKLILSSEWDFSPYTYPYSYENVRSKKLPNFVFIGLPASESSNPLLIPLAGHELGHSIWNKNSIKDKISEKVKEEIIKELILKFNEFTRLFPDTASLFPDNKDKFKIDSLSKKSMEEFWEEFSLSYSSAMNQIQEIFCDMMGIRIFAESYFWAFSYLLAPGMLNRNVNYPIMKDRIEYQIRAAKAYNINVPDDYSKKFFNGNTSVDLDEKFKFKISIADCVREKFIESMITHCKEISEGKIPERNKEKVSNISKAYKSFIIPTTQCCELTDIINAGWERSLEISDGNSDEQRRTLFDLIFKSLEISTIYKNWNKR